MKSPTSLWARPAAILVLSLSLNSCGDDPELVTKREQQRAEFSKLQGELSILQERMETIPQDRSKELAELKQTVEDNRSQIATLEREIESLEKEKAEIEKQHQAYRRKYVAQ
jgi:chromosome segregation ATPase